MQLIRPLQITKQSQFADGTENEIGLCSRTIDIHSDRIKYVDDEMYACWSDWLGRRLTAALKDAASPEEICPKYECSVIVE